MTAFTETDLKRLAALVQERRVELRLGIQPAAVEAGMSKDTWKRVEVGLAVRATTYPGIERALQWAPGSCVRILEGGEPRSAESADADAEEPLKAAKLDPQDFEQAFVSAMIVTKGDLTGNEIRELSDRVIAELKRRGAL